MMSIKMMKMVVIMFTKRTIIITLSIKMLNTVMICWTMRMTMTNDIMSFINFSALFICVYV